MKRERTNGQLADALVELLSDDGDSDDEVKDDLVAQGVDVTASRASYRALLTDLERRAARALMQDATRRSALRSASREDLRRQISDERHSMEELARRVADLGGKRAARGHERDTREDLESQLADLLVAEEDE